MKDQVLSIEQMQKLIKLGIGVSKASMYWRRAMNYMTGEWDSGTLMIGSSIGTYPSLEYIPTFTLQDILDRLPKNIFVDLETESEKDYYLSTNLIDSFYYITGYNEDVPLVYVTENNLLEAAFNILKWCKQNEHL